MRLFSVVGARPQFVKLGPISRAIARHNSVRGRGEAIEEVVVHTGQHYDHAMSEVFFSELQLPRPRFNLGVGSGAHGEQTARMLERLEQLFIQERPDAVATFGDTNSTLAATLAAAKLHVPLAHVESGLRSFNRAMPEEINRIVADHLSDLLLAPTHTAMSNLANEGLAARARLTGDVMLDSVRFNLELAQRSSQALDRLRLERGKYAVATIHRAENTQLPQLAAVLDAFQRLAAEGETIVFPVHPRTLAALRDLLPADGVPDRLRLVEPLSYLDMLQVVARSWLVLTDSGGLQKEAFFLGRPCLTLREETEWTETVQARANILVGTDPERILAGVRDWRVRARQGLDGFETEVTRFFGAPGAAERIVVELPSLA